VLAHNAVRVELADAFRLLHAALRLGRGLAPRHAGALRAWWGHFHPALTGLSAAVAEVLLPWAAAAAPSAPDPAAVTAAVAALAAAVADAQATAIGQCWAFDRGAYASPAAAVVGLWATATGLVRGLLPAYAAAEAALPVAAAAHYRKADGARVERALLTAVAFPRGRRGDKDGTGGAVSVEGGEAVAMVLRGAGSAKAARGILRNGGLSAAQRAAHGRWVEGLEKGHWGVVQAMRAEAEAVGKGGDKTA